MFGKLIGSPASTGSDNDVETKAVTETGVRTEPQHDVVQIVDDHEENDLSRSLSQRHIQMIALAGAIVRVLHHST
jgi:amino acid transporter